MRGFRSSLPMATEGGALELSVVNPAGIFGPVLGADFRPPRAREACEDAIVATAESLVKFGIVGSP